MDMSQLNMNDPQIQAFIAEYMRKQQQPGGPTPPQMPQQQAAPAPAAPAVPQPGLQNGPQMPPPAAGAMQPPGGAPGAPGAPPGPPGGQLSPELVESVIGLQGQGGERKALDRQYALADAMRAQGERGMQQRIIPSSTGGMVVAPNWASGLASLGSSYMSSKREREADEKGAALDKKRQDAQRAYFGELTGQMRRRNPRDEDLGAYF